MRYFLLIMFIGFIAFSSCEYRTHEESMKQSIAKFKNSIRKTEITEYFPREYAEVQTDTILSNGYYVKIKNFTNMNTSIVKNFTLNNIDYKQHFRQIESEIVVYKNDKLIFKEHVNESFLRQNSGFNIASNQLLSTGFFVDEIQSLEKNKLVLVGSQTKPKDKSGTSYNLIIDEKGTFRIKEIDYART